jgi:hypothetical protein
VRSVGSMGLTRRTRPRPIVERLRRWQRIGGLVLLLLTALPGLASAAAPAWRVVAQTNSTVAPGGTTTFRVEVKNTGDATAGGSPMAFSGSMSSGLQVTAISVVAPTPSAWSCFTRSLPARTVSCSNSSDTVLSQARVLFEVTAQATSSEGAIEVGTFGMTGGGASLSTSPAPIAVSSTLPDFGIDVLDGATTEDAAGSLSTQAGAHPYATSVSLQLNTVHNPAPLIGDLWPVEAVRDVVTDLPPGLVGNPSGLAQCTTAELANGAATGARPLCAPSSQVGTAVIRLNGKAGVFDALGPLPVFNMVPPPGVPARFGFNVLGVLVTLDARVRSGSDYGLSVVASNTAEAIPIAGTTVTFWGVPSDTSHDPERACPGQKGPWDAGPSCTSSAPRAAFLRNPTSCEPAPGSPVDDGLATTMHVDSWAHPGRVGADGLPDLSDPAWKSTSYVTHEPPGYPFPEGDWGAHVLPTGCDAVPFSPTLAGLPEAGAKPGAPTGFNFDVTLPQSDDPLTVGSSDLRKAVVTLPQGIRVSPSAANGRQACSSAQIALHSAAEPTCPDASKIGSVRIETPLLPDPLEGSVYLAAQNDNPFNSLLAIYFVVHGPGVIVKLAGHVQADPVTGQLTTAFDDNPQLPFSRLHLAVDGGPHAALVLPQQCGSYTTTGTLTSWSGKTVPSNSAFSVSGDAAECSGGMTFSPGFAAGTENPIAGEDSTFNLRLTRDDRDQQISSLEVTTPQGLTGVLKGISPCPESVLAAFPNPPIAGKGAAELALPSCPAASQVGRVIVGAGAGTDPFYAQTGKAYLAGPYRGAPLSLAVTVPAVAGPFDLGTVLVRNAIHVDPIDAHLTVKSDPLPTILQGIPLDVRDIRISMDRPNFMLNPTSCNEMSIGAQVKSTAGSLATPSNRFQVGECSRLGFKPKLTLRLRGGTKRTQHPALTAILRPRPGDANISRVSVALPKSEFLDQAHLVNICTRAQFAASACPRGAIYGHATVITPLFDEPLTGPVYLRSSRNLLPDLVPDLRGPANLPIRIESAGRIDEIGGGIRNTFDFIPDAPFTKLVMRLKGGNKGLLQNSRNICRRAFRATVKMDAHNGKVHDTRPMLKASCPKKGKRNKKR